MSIMPSASEKFFALYVRLMRENSSFKTRDIIRDKAESSQHRKNQASSPADGNFNYGMIMRNNKLLLEGSSKENLFLLEEALSNSVNPDKTLHESVSPKMLKEEGYSILMGCDY